MSLTEAQKKAKARYKRKAVKDFTIECYPAEADIIAKLEAEKQAGGYATYIKSLIRKDLANK